MERLRILTFNVAHGRGLTPIQGFTSGRKIRVNLRKIARMLQRLSPDIVALQEVDECSRWAGNFDHLDYLRLHAGYKYAVFGITNRRSGLLNLSYGNAILSRHPILESETIVFGASRVGEKGFLFVEVDVNGMHVPLVNLHLHYRSRDHRFVQTERLLAWMHDKQRRRRGDWAVLPILCGDLNNPGHLSDATATLLSHLFDYCDYTLHPREGRTFPSPLPTRLLDFVFLPDGCRDAESRIVRTFLSDHRPVMVEFGIG
jgi:endonuclease/exonuclease/phosphatase family metal-dependent hydrolase